MITYTVKSLTRNSSFQSLSNNDSSSKLLFWTISIFLFLSFNSLSAQIAKGDILTGGALYYSMSNSEGITPTDTNINASTNFSISAIGGYFVADRFVVGLGIGYSRVASKNNYWKQICKQTILLEKGEIKSI